MSKSEAGSDVPEKLRDGRDPGEWQTSYDRRALCQIYLELAYLLGLLAFSLYHAFQFAFIEKPAVEASQAGTSWPTPEQAHWLAIGLGGTIGGTVFALKWHYHSVAKRIWHQDRLVWRITAPVLSGVLATFVIMMIRSEIIPLLSVQKLSTTFAAMSFAFFLGLFSDNLLASLQNLAAQIFGTLRDRNQSDVRSENFPKGSDG